MYWWNLILIFLTDIMELKCSFIWLAIKLMLHSTQINEVRLQLTTTDNFIRSHMTSWPCRLKKTSSMQSKHHDLHNTWLHHETNEKQFILGFADFMTQILWEHFFLFLSKTKNNFYFLILLVKLSAIWFVICTNIITAV